MSLSIRIWQPSPLHTVALATSFHDDVARNADRFERVEVAGVPVTPSVEIPNPFFLPPRSDRYYCYLLAKTAANRMVLGVAPFLGVASFLGDRHMQIAKAMMKTEEGSLIYLAGGEMRVFNPWLQASLGMLDEVNETSGYLAQKRQEEEKVIQQRLIRIPDFLRHFGERFGFDPHRHRNSVQNMTRLLANERKPLPFAVSKYLTARTFNRESQHLDPKLNELAKADNIRDAILGRIAILEFPLHNYHMKRDGKEFRTELLEYATSLEVMRLAWNALKRDNPVLAKHSLTLPTLSDIEKADAQALDEIAKQLQDGMKLFNQIWPDKDKESPLDLVDVFRL